ncbi:probable UDP-sugar transporter protein SLC35A5 isoform X1 [Choloepus didactylus]|nr:probable UDP-sugar transporter protein SLC35A5 isoform X1 [Choloepus didactylus]XP_037691327.1 probable UDP-sugar transporter protein SLC35A5 isoform X1 [Choloepus didactylus]XP_037691330.1 probable UDP-sugar transporter protein SLC35A5 isoform X1 [Choloepus didactylus]XP_037691335.1 probable UDP-sugar transporter protein SLC35A5 isoform X1 [Choloepus didactylus]XP_037691339.1 probable UDP-sugar transporter protein SLC35A5 isoform X1 [Choloepus didactylus]XP_037691345.1 probable UDP-sugar t
MERKCSGHPMFCSLLTMYMLLLGAIFITLSSSRILLVKYSANAENKYDYLPTTVNVCSELVKLIFCVLVSFWVIKKQDHQSKNLKCASWKEFSNFMKWSIPAFLYFLDNLIVFYVLSYLQPAMAVIFSNFSIITTALLFRIVLKRHLNWIQWASLLILFLSIVALTAGTETSQHNLAGHGFHHDAFFSPSNSCLLFRSECSRKDNCTRKEWIFPEAKWKNTTARVFSHIRLGLGHVLIIGQCFISSMANIYNEKILKEGNQLTESIFIQNSKLYFFGILFNGLTLGLQSSNRDQIKNCGFFYGHNTFSVALIFVTAFQGLSVAFILKFLDNMFHVLMAQITTVIITTVSVLVFDFSPSLEFFLEASSVLLSIFIYNASKSQGLEYAPRQERIRHLSGGLWERSSGDGEELERLTKPKSDIESDEDAF